MTKSFHIYAKPLWLMAVSLACILSSCSKQPKEELIPEIIEKAELNEAIEAVIPHIYIDIEDGNWVTEKDVYLNAEVKIEGMEKFPDLAVTETRIKGRGNSTWGKPKKPYRLKLDEKASILGLPAAKDWVLLANYQDYTLMTNAVAMKIGQQLGLPYTNTIIPVDLTINGEYQGNYNLTQQIEVKDSRVNVGDDGVLIEMDVNYDEDFQFISTAFELPVMIKSPDIESDEQFNAIKDEFETLLNLIASPSFPNNGYGELFDKKQLVNYMIVNDLSVNFEINHPKSVYLHKAKGGKYTMGPLWDFDWGFGMDENSRIYFNHIDIPLFRPEDPRKAAVFFTTLLKDPEVRALYRQQWDTYRSKHFDALMNYIEEYAAKIRLSQPKDYELWKVGVNNLPQYKADMKTFLRKRAQYIDQYVSKL